MAKDNTTLSPYWKGYADGRRDAQKQCTVRMLKQTVKHGKEQDKLLDKVCKILREAEFFDSEEFSPEVLEYQFRQMVKED